MSHQFTGFPSPRSALPLAGDLLGFFLLPQPRLLLPLSSLGALAPMGLVSGEGKGKRVDSTRTFVISVGWLVGTADILSWPSHIRRFSWDGPAGGLRQQLPGTREASTHWPSQPVPASNFSRSPTPTSPGVHLGRIPFEMSLEDSISRLHIWLMGAWTFVPLYSRGVSFPIVALCPCSVARSGAPARFSSFNV